MNNQLTQLVQQYKIKNLHRISKTHISRCCEAPVWIVHQFDSWPHKVRYRCVECKRLATPLNLKLGTVSSKFNADVFVAELQQSLLGSSGNGAKRPIEQHSTGYPKADKSTKITELGVILDYHTSALDLSKTVNLPNNLKWVTVNNIEEFAQILDRGVPAFVNFGQVNGKLGNKSWDVVDCGKLYVKTCKQQGLKTLPGFACTNPTQSKKDQVDLMLLEYS